MPSFGRSSINALLFIATFLGFVAGANGAIVYVASSAATTTNNFGSQTVNIDPNPAWYGPLPGSEWISFGPTGDPDEPGYFTVPNETVVSFTTHFFLDGPVTAATLIVLADDSTSVMLNGHLLTVESTIPGSTCSTEPIGCLLSTEGEFTLAQMASYLVVGTNTLKFGVEQVNGSSFGLDFAGSFTTADCSSVATPEGAPGMVVGLGLIVLVLLKSRVKYVTDPRQMWL